MYRQSRNLQIPPAMYKDIATWLMRVYQKRFNRTKDLKREYDDYIRGEEGPRSRSKQDQLSSYKMLVDLGESGRRPENLSKQFPLDFRGWAYANKFDNKFVRPAIDKAFPRGLKVTLGAPSIWGGYDDEDGGVYYYDKRKEIVVNTPTLGENVHKDVQQVLEILRHELQHFVQDLFSILRGSVYGEGGGLGKRRNIKPKDQEDYYGLMEEYKPQLNDAIRLTLEKIRKEEGGWNASEMRDFLRVMAGFTNQRSPFFFFRYYRKHNPAGHKQIAKEFYQEIMREINRRPQYYGYRGGARRRMASWVSTTYLKGNW